MIKQYGRYTIDTDQELGRGAFGRVYRSFDPNLNIPVAIKVLRSNDEVEMLSRFEAEARTSARLLHVNIVRVYDFAQQEGTPYLVMELLEGQTLHQILGSVGLGLLEKVEIMYQVGEGLRHAHDHNVIHRDMKPGNIMVQPNGVPKILDFGIARALDTDATRRTREGDVAGTISWMAPELISPKPVDADRLTDIWAYGVIYYELLTGTQPFYADNIVTAIYLINSYEPPPLRQTQPEIPRALEHLVLRRLLSKDRELRVDKMADVLLDMQPILQHLRQGRAEGIANEVRPLVEAGDFEAAKVRIDEILRLNPLHSEARQWRDDFQAQAQRGAIRARVDALVRTGTELFAARRFAEAKQCFENALKRDAGRPDAVSLLEQATAMMERARSAARLVAEAHEEAYQTRLDQAFQRVSEAIRLDPGNLDAVSLCADIGLQLRDRRIDETVARAEGLCNAGEHDAALSALEELDAEAAGAAKVSRLRERVETARAEADRLRLVAEFQTAFAKAREALSAGMLTEAEEAAQTLCYRYPDNPEAVAFRSAVHERQAEQRRREAIGAISLSARAQIKEKRLDEARKSLERGLDAYPGETVLLRLLEATIQLEDAQKRADAINLVLQQANDLREKGALEKALETVDSAVARYGRESILMECRRNLEFEWEQREYKRGLDRLMVEAMMLRANQEPGKAVALLKDAITRYPGEPDLTPMLESARGEVAALREREALRETQQSVAALEASGDLSAGLAAADSALERHAGDPVLLASAERLRAAIQEGQHRARIKALETSVKASLGKGDFTGAVEQLAAARSEYSQESVWQTLWRELEGAVLAAEDRLSESVSQLGAAAEHLHEPELTRLLALAREALTARLESEALKRALEQERSRAIGAHVEQIGRAIDSKDWDRATADLAAVERDFGADPAFAALPRAIREGRRRAELAVLASQVRKDLSQRNFEGVVAKLAATRAELSQEALWQTLWRELERRLSAGRKGLAGALSVLEDLASRHTGEPELQRLLSAARGQSSNQTLGRIAALEIAGQLSASLLEAEMELERHPADPLVAEAVNRLRTKLREQEDARQVAERVTKILKAIDMGAFDAAVSDLSAARAEFGDSPVLQDLAAAIQENRLRAELKALENRVRTSFARGDLQEAEKQLEATRAALSQEAEWQALSHEWKLRQSYETNLALAEDACRKHNFSRAREILESLLPDAPDGRVKRLLAEIAETERNEAARKERLQAIAKGREDAGKYARNGDLDAALGILKGLIERFPTEADVRKDFEDATRQSEIQRLAKKSSRLLSEGKPEEVIDLLRLTPSGFREHPEIGRTWVAAERALEERRQQYSSGRSEVEKRVEARDYEAAVGLLRRLLISFPNDERLELDLRRAISAQEQSERQQRTLRWEQGHAEVQRLLRQQQFGAAIQSLNSLLMEYPDDDGLKKELEAAIAAQDRHAQKQVCEQGRREAEDLIRTSQFDAAIGRLQPLLTRFPGEATLEQCLEAATAAKAAHQRKQSYSRGREEVQQLLRQRKFDAAIRALESLLKQFPNDPGLEQELQSAIATKDLHAERSNVNQRVAELEKLYRKGKAQSVKERATELLAVIEEPRARELLEWADAMISRPPSGILPPMPVEKKRWLTLNLRVYIWLSLLIVTLTAGLIFLKLRGPHPGKLIVKSAGLSFTGPLGGNPPEPQTISVEGSDPSRPLAVSSSEGWISATAQGATITVTVDPRGLAAGTNSGFVMVKDAQSQSVVPVQLTLAAPPTPPPLVAAVEPPPPPEPRDSSVRRSKSGSTVVPASPVSPGPATGPPADSPSGQNPATGITNVTPAQPPPVNPTRLQPLPPVDCSESGYRKSKRGTLSWIGELKPGDDLVLGRDRAVISGGVGGRVEGQGLPGCPVEIDSHSENVTIVEYPSADNEFSRIKLRKSNGQSTGEVSFHWIKK